jgi:hypothetical protein
MAHTDTVSSLNETLTHSLTRLRVVKATIRFLEKTGRLAYQLEAK